MDAAQTTPPASLSGWRIARWPAVLLGAAIAVTAGCSSSSSVPGGVVQADMGEAHDAGRRTPRPRGAGTGDEPSTPAVEEEPPAAGEDAGAPTCDRGCLDDSQCREGQFCFSFAGGGRCAPATCDACDLGCLYDPEGCTKGVCPTTDPHTTDCGAPCENSSDCPAGLACRNQLGFGECVPEDCSRCTGDCVYSAACVFESCYALEALPTVTPTWCAHFYF